MKLYLIRHGQTNWNLKQKIQGSCDIELNDTGKKQAEELSNKILKESYKFSKIYTSPKRRASETAEILSRITDIEYVSIEDLKEMDFGEWEGLSWSEVKQRYPTEYKEWYTNRRYTKTPKGESYQAMLNRILTVLRKIINENCNDVAVVTHSAIIMSLQCYITNTPFEKMMEFRTDNTAITQIDSELLL